MGRDWVSDVDDDGAGSVVIGSGSGGLYGTGGYAWVGAIQVLLMSFVSWVNVEVGAELDGIAVAPSSMIGSEGMTVEASDESWICAPERLSECSQVLLRRFDLQMSALLACPTARSLPSGPLTCGMAEISIRRSASNITTTNRRAGSAAGTSELIRRRS